MLYFVHSGKYATKKDRLLKKTKKYNWAGSKTTTLFDLWLTPTCSFFYLIHWAVLTVTSILIFFPWHCLNRCASIPVSSFCAFSLLLSRMDAQTHWECAQMHIYKHIHKRSPRCCCCPCVCVCVCV